MDVKALVGWNLRRIRVGRGISQEGLGLIIGCEPSYVGRVERGTENATISTLEAFAGALDVHVSSFFVVPDKSETASPTLKPGRKRKAP